MKLNLESTGEVLKFQRGDQSMTVRVWTGTTAEGTPVKAYIASVSPQSLDEAALAAFEGELSALQAEPAIEGIALRFIL